MKLMNWSKNIKIKLLKIQWCYFRSQGLAINFASPYFCEKFSNHGEHYKRGVSYAKNNNYFAHSNYF